MTTLICTAIEGAQGVWSCHFPNQPLGEGIGVYRFPYHWECQQHGRWMPWLPKGGLPCNCIQMALKKLQETP